MIRIEIDIKNVMNMLNALKRTLPASAREGVWNVTKKLEEELKKEVQKQGLIWRGKLLKNIEARKLSKDAFGIFMPYYGTYLDSMPTHWVALKRGRLITQWAKEKAPRAFGAIEVHKHPFIDKPLNKVRRQAKRIVENEINKTIRKKGR